MAAISAAVSEQPNMTLWTDIEAFTLEPNYTVAPTSRFLEQLQLEYPHVSGATAWEFTGCMDPHSELKNRQASLRLYNEYKQYLAKKTDDPTADAMQQLHKCASAVPHRGYEDTSLQVAALFRNYSVYDGRAAGLAKMAASFAGFHSRCLPPR